MSETEIQPVELTEEQPNHVLGLIQQETARTDWAGIDMFPAMVAERLTQAGGFSDQAVLDAVNAVDAEWRQRAASSTQAPAPQATGDGSIPADVLAQLAPGEYRRVQYPDGSVGVEEPGEVLKFFDARRVKLPAEDNEKVRSGKLTEMQMAKVYGSHNIDGATSIVAELAQRKALVKQAEHPAPRRPETALDRVKQRQDADRELRHTDPDPYRRKVAERNREVVRQRRAQEAQQRRDLATWDQELRTRRPKPA
jgi:hypothetical protein